MQDDTRVEWREWGPEAFAEARRAAKPVLLSLSATWCAGCHEMDAETYGEPRIAANVNDGFVPVRVDVDRHPRVRERYNMGGFPSTVFLTPDGELLTGATYLGPDGTRQVLDSVREMWDARGTSAGRIPRALAGNPTPAGEVTGEIEARFAGQLAEVYDPEFAGWGTDAKFPMPRTVEFALKREREQALRTLEAIAESLLDDAEGGFFRYANARNWRDRNREKLLDANAGLVRAFANAYLYTGDETYREPATATIGYLRSALWSGVAFGGSQGPAEGSDYYDLDAEERADARKPRTDLTAYAGPNALAADALLTYHAYTDDGAARDYARRTLDYLEAELLADPASLAAAGRDSTGGTADLDAADGSADAGDGRGDSADGTGGDDGPADGNDVDPDVPGRAVVRFHADGGRGEAGLLTDHARVVTGFCRAEQVLGEGLDAARDAADYAIATLFDEGSFRDGPAAGPGLLDRPLRPIDGNVEMAEALLDLAALTGEDRYRERAADAVAAFAGARDRIGVQVAGYGSVAARLRRSPPVVAVGTEPGSDLHRAALRIADHEKVVIPRAHERDPAVAGGAEIENGTAALLGDDGVRVASTPDELMSVVAERTGE